MALSAYERQLQELGWNAVDPYDRGPQGSFLSRRGAEGFTLRRGGQGPVLRAVAVAGAGQSVDLRAILDWELPRHMDAPSSGDGRVRDLKDYSHPLLY